MAELQAKLDVLHGQYIGAIRDYRRAPMDDTREARAMSAWAEYSRALNEYHNLLASFLGGK